MDYEWLMSGSSVGGRFMIGRAAQKRLFSVAKAFFTSEGARLMSGTVYE